MKDVFVHAMPACGGERLLSFGAGYQGSPRRERFYHATGWVIKLLRELHVKVLGAATPHERDARMFYIPTFFALLIALRDDDSLACLAASVDALTNLGSFRRNGGYDHFYLHGLEHPVVTDFDYADLVGRMPSNAVVEQVASFYALTQNVAMVSTGDLAQGTLTAALNGALYSMRRVVNAPFVFEEDCQAERFPDVAQPRQIHLTFTGSIQSYNFERLAFLRAAQAEFGERLMVNSNGRAELRSPRLRLRALVQLDPHSPPLNSSERAKLGGSRSWLWHLYRRSTLCVVAPGDAPVLGQRLSDVLAGGCLPVVLIGPGAYPVLPLASAVPWEEFAILVRLGNDVPSVRWALRRLLALTDSEIARRQAALRRWRPHLAFSRSSQCSSLQKVGPEAGDLILAELRALQTLWRWQVPGGTLDLNASTCLGQSGFSASGSRCYALEGRLLP